jgi:hypothetical protein
MSEFIINPYTRTVQVKGFDFIADEKYSVDDFLQLCFRNNWEGTALRVRGSLDRFDAFMSKQVDDFISAEGVK